MKKIYYLLIMIFYLFQVSPSYAGEIFPKSSSFIEQSGDIIQIAIPISALIYTIVIKDEHGVLLWVGSNTATLVTTQILKTTVKERRPDGSNMQSFPSGHTSASFAGAAYWQMRYGWYIGAPMYVLASYVGYSRIYAKKHHYYDVLAGAAIGIGFNLLLTTTYMPEGTNFSVAPYKNGTAIFFTAKF